jgi:hypothetical protein
MGKKSLESVFQKDAQKKIGSICCCVSGGCRLNAIFVTLEKENCYG